jgi:hypothetical protein
MFARLCSLSLVKTIEASDGRQVTLWEKEGIKGCLKEYSLRAMVEGGRGVQVCMGFLAALASSTYSTNLIIKRERLHSKMHLLS